MLRTGKGIRCLTSPDQWSYALSFEIPKEALAINQRLSIKIAGVVEAGNIGVGAVEEDLSTYIVEEQFRPGDLDISIFIPADRTHDARRIIIRNAEAGSRQSQIAFSSIEISTSNATEMASLTEVTRRPFQPHADRNRPFKLASINTTETCNLTCVMCHFNGPNAIKKSGTLEPRQVETALRNIPSGETVWFCATGEFFLDINALDYLRQASARGLKPCVLTHGQLFTPELIDAVLESGVRMIRMSVDTTDENQYRKIRRGGELRNIIEACKYLRQRKREAYPDLRVEINATLFKNTFSRQGEMENFWRGLVDQVNFNAEYHDTFNFRNLFFIPERRVNCDIQLYVMPSGRISPCCAIAVYQHDHDVSWLPHIDDIGSLQEAHARLCDLYEDPDGPMASICSKCDWWILSMSGNSPYIRAVDLSKSKDDV
jgi:MoaA/NifB/PqqE/SkfB family radical SAM enzyme